MSITVTPDFKDLDKAVAALNSLDSSYTEEFKTASETANKYIVRDLQRGVAVVSGGVKGGITGEVTQASGVEVTSVVRSRSSNQGYDYGARLDNDGYFRWRTGRFRGRRTFGWFHTALPRIGKRIIRRYYERALTAILERLKAKL